jgi:hypothetical protein
VRGVECLVELEARWADVDRRHPPLHAALIQILPNRERRIGGTVLRASNANGPWIYRGQPIYPPYSGNYSLRITQPNDSSDKVLATLFLNVVDEKSRQQN